MSIWKDVFLLGVLFVIMVLVICKGLVWAHDMAIVGCKENIPINGVDLLSSEQMENGIILERYDRNEDGRPDIVAGSEGESIENHQEFPLYYIVDTDLDGHMDTVYVDTTEGITPLVARCFNIVPVWMIKEKDDIQVRR